MDDMEVQSRLIRIRRGHAYTRSIERDVLVYEFLRAVAAGNVPTNYIKECARLLIEFDLFPRNSPPARSTIAPVVP